MKAPPRSVRAKYDQQNEQAARIILQNVAKHGGEDSGMVVWARLCLARIERERQERIGPLFGAASSASCALGGG